jgi:hypothetical protein
MKRSLLVLAVAATVAISGCSSGDSNSDSGTTASAATEASQRASSPAESAEPGDVAIGGASVPDSWPAEVPPYAGGTLMTAVVLDDGGTINASWATDQDADAAWADMDAQLRDRGYVPVGDLGEESLYINDETQITDTYRSDSFEVNIVVVRGEQATVFVNASRLR